MPIPPFIADLRQKVGHDLLLLPTIIVIARDPQGRLLLVHDRDSDLWTLPGGIIEPGETPANAAVREVWEETRVHAELTHIIAVMGGSGCETRYRNGDHIAWVATVFAAQVPEGAPVADGGEIMAARLVSTDELGALCLRADSQRLLAVEEAGPAFFEPATWSPAT